MAENGTVRVGIIGDRESVLGFMALGYTVCEASDAETARKALRELAQDESFGIIFITEALAPELTEEIDRYKDSPLPAIITIPTAGGAGKGYGMHALHRAVERAVGADILDQ
ncbi:MAG: V-type ATP synthase subunit F [Clostridia bacterium]|nr:V-type ATP synthase subunit F [Clostridia bacterium]